MHERDYGALLARRREALDPNTERVKVIAAATDFSPTATSAARRAAQLAHGHGAQLALIHVLPPRPRSVATLLMAPGTYEESPNAGEAFTKLRRAAAQIISEFGVSVEIHLASGHVPRGIAALAKAAHADLIVLGNSQRNFIIELLYTRTARRVRRWTNIPVLAASSPIWSTYTRVLLAVDLTPEAAHAGNVARRLFPHSTLFVLHSVVSPYEGMLGLADASEDAKEAYRRVALEDGKHRLSRFAKDNALHPDAILQVCVGNPTACIRKHARALGVDVVVLGSATPSPARWMSNSVAAELLADPPCDMLLVGSSQPGDRRPVPNGTDGSPALSG